MLLRFNDSTLLRKWTVQSLIVVQTLVSGNLVLQKNFFSYTFEIVGEKIPNSYAGSLNRIKGATGLKIPLAPRLISQRHPLPSLLFQLVNVKPFFLGGFAYTRTLAHNKVD